jgi:hypothetical protein
MGIVINFERNGLSATHLRLLAEQLNDVHVDVEWSDDGLLFAMIDDDRGVPLEVGLRNGLFVAARGGRTFAQTRRFVDIVLAVSQEINDCM